MGIGDRVERVIVEETYQVNRLILQQQDWQLAREHLSGCLPEEGCGLIGGSVSGSEVWGRLVLPVENLLHSPVRYRMNPQRQLQALQKIDDTGLQLVGIFHSHPDGPQTPSITDMNEFLYPGVLALILSRPDGTEDWILRAFHVSDGGFFEIQASLG